LSNGLTDDFSVTMFRVMIIPPLSARGLSGKLVRVDGHFRRVAGISGGDP